MVRAVNIEERDPAALDRDLTRLRRPHVVDARDADEAVLAIADVVNAVAGHAVYYNAMASHRIAARPPCGAPHRPAPITDPDRLRLVAEDAAHVAGHASALVAPATEAEVADVLRSADRVLAIGAQSSLTGGATPLGDVVLSTSRFNRILEIGADRVRVEAGVTLADLDAALAAAGCYYPPAPTFTGAFVGGTVATNAAGAATFKYGTTRDWVEGITIVLPTGDVLDIERGAVVAHADGYFEFVLRSGPVRVVVPGYRMPRVPKLSAGYFAAAGMDLIDLFVGAEGTLGVVVNVTLRTVAPRPAWCLAFVPFADRRAGFAFVRTLRDTARETWRTRDSAGLDVAAIEHLDARCLELAREDGIDRRTGVTWPDGTAMALLVTLELRSGMTTGQAFDEIGRAHDQRALDTPLARFYRAVDGAGAIEDVQIAVPGDNRRWAQLTGLREEVPASVNARIGRAKQDVDARIEKTAGDMIVPFNRLEELLACYEGEFRRRALDAAVWGHISDGNLHANVLPRSFADVESGRAAILEVGREAIRLGGSPLAEHGVGRSAVKQQLLEQLYGRHGIEEMRAVKRALDPQWKLASGVLFPAAERQP
jgi:D-lactate dehydrogenase (cytochrome)